MRRFINTVVIATACALILAGAFTLDVRASWSAVIGTLLLFILVPMFVSIQE